MTLRAAVAAFALLLLTAASAPRESMLVSTAWLAEHLGDPGLVILHVGTPASYATHIPGARHMTLADISVTSEGGGTLEMLPAAELRLRLSGLGISDRSRIVVYYAEAVPQATRVVFTLDAAGLGDRTSLLDGGLPAWTREMRPLSAEVPTAHIGSLSPLEMKSNVIVDADFVREHAAKAGYAVIDARVPEFYSGAKPGGSAERPHKAGHIPGAKNVPVTTLTDEKLNVAPAASIKAAFDKAGVKPGDKLVVYCHIGQQATAVIFAARTLGYDAVLYDGSFEDWSRKDLPVEK
ncbi:MAG: sulfurtransferase [Rhodospirillaceae bacterium]